MESNLFRWQDSELFEHVRTDQRTSRSHLQTCLDQSLVFDVAHRLDLRIEKSSGAAVRQKIDRQPAHVRY